MDSDINALEQHLLYHKALAESPEEAARVDSLLANLDAAANNTKLNDPVDDTIRRMFSLVLDEGLDPWNIDLEYFVSEYAKKVAQNEFDILVAGKLIYMAWCILHKQASESEDRMTVPSCEDAGDDGGEDFFTDEESEIVVPVPDVKFVEAPVRKRLIRPVTMMELMEAFDEAVAEEKIREEREETRKKLQEKRAGTKVKFDNKAHEEDDETVVKKVYKAIIEKYSNEPVALSTFYNGDIGNAISYFVSVLHLVRYGLVDVDQQSFPNGDIMITVLDPSKEVPLGNEA